MAPSRVRWSAVGAAVAVSLGAGGIGLSQAAIGSGQKPVSVAIAPCRLVDTRPGPSNIGGRTTPLGADDTLVLQVTGSVGECSGVPADAVAAALNVTAIQGSAQSYLSIYPSDAALPNASSLNWGAGDPPTPNKVDVKLGPTGAIKITNSVGTVHVAVDLVGYTIDHHHDDRYYTKAEVDTLVAGIGDWTVAIDPTDLVAFSASGMFAGGGQNGFAFAPGSNTTAFLGFQLPVRYEAGTDVEIEFRQRVVTGFGALSFPCGTVWRIGTIAATRATATITAPAAQWATPFGSDDFTNVSWTQAQYDRGTLATPTVTIDGTQLQPGDQLTTTFVRFGADAADTCAGALIAGAIARPA